MAVCLRLWIGVFLQFVAQEKSFCTAGHVKRVVGGG